MQISENVTLSKIREAEHNLSTVFFWRFQCLNKETGKKSTYLNAEVTTMQGKYSIYLQMSASSPRTSNGQLISKYVLEKTFLVRFDRTNLFHRSFADIWTDWFCTHLNIYHMSMSMVDMGHDLGCRL